MTAPADAAALARLDALAIELVRRAAPVRLGIAHSAAELEAVYRLRYTVVIDRGWAQPAAFPDGLERDIFDDDAIQVVAWSAERLVGTTRLVLPTPGRLLPTETVFSLNVQSRGQVIDMGRTCRAPDYKDTGHMVLWGVLGQAWIETRARGLSEFCGIFDAAVVRLYRRLGLHAEILGEPRLHWGEPRYPVLVTPTKSAHALREPESSKPEIRNKFEIQNSKQRRLLG